MSLAATILIAPSADGSPAAQPLLRGSQGSYTTSIYVATTPEKAWKVLTNYEATATAMPDIKLAKLISRQGNKLEVAQTYQAPYTFGLRIKARLAITENPPRQMSYRLISGDRIRNLEGNWSLTPVKGGVLVKHQIKIDPDLPAVLRPLYFELSETNLKQSMNILRNLMERS
ncbi:SRPBCC family protein [Cyanobium sp. ATX 6F1]|uniref:SRPBCC family protein n=1 Tax=unclassified Cyanobium TaxID=2627006 RepID=UPI0020CC9A58|nr:SRPBCC family protein [Cyanobium sp. ATX 6F1]MCP9916668.1 SRPBCC family protein [Cyanobium sp. ATX 6F1]